MASGIPYGQGLVKNRYIGRTFIAPTQAERANGVRRKLNPLRENITGKRLVVVDDSIVRGTTTRAMVKMLRESGATEVHLRISSPPFRWPCFYGIDTPDRTELLAAIKTNDGDRRVPRRRLARVPDPRQPGRGHRRPGRRVLRRLPDRQLPGAGAGARCRRDRPQRGDQRDPGVTGVDSHPTPDQLSPPDRERPTAADGRLDLGGSAGDLCRRRRGHRGRRAGRRSHQAAGGVHPPPRGARRHRRLRRPVRPGYRPVPPARCWWPGPTGWAPRRWWPRTSAASTPSGSTWWPCASTTWCARAPSRCSSSTTSRAGSVEPSRWPSWWRAWPRVAGRSVPPSSAGEMAEHPGVMKPGEFDLVGFAVGVVERDEMLGPARVAAGRRADRAGVPGPALQRLLPGPARAARAGRADPRRPGVAGRQPSRWPTSCCGRRSSTRRRCGRPSPPARSGRWRTPWPTSPGAGSRATCPGPCPTGCAPSSTGARGRCRRSSARSGGSGKVTDDEMARVFNLGLGMVMVVDPAASTAPSRPSAGRQVVAGWPAGRRPARRSGRARRRALGRRESSSAPDLVGPTTAAREQSA